MKTERNEKERNKKGKKLSYGWGIEANIAFAHFKLERENFYNGNSVHDEWIHLLSYCVMIDRKGSPYISQLYTIMHYFFTTFSVFGRCIRYLCCCNRSNFITDAVLRFQFSAYAHFIQFAINYVNTN